MSVRTPKEQEEYNNAPIIPLEISSYNRILLLMYKKVVFRPLYLSLFTLLVCPPYFFSPEFISYELAIITTISIFAIAILIFPPALVYFFFLLAKLKIWEGPRKFGKLQDI